MRPWRWRSPRGVCYWDSFSHSRRRTPTSYVRRRTERLPCAWAVDIRPGGQSLGLGLRAVVRSHTANPRDRFYFIASDGSGSVTLIAQVASEDVPALAIQTVYDFFAAHNGGFAAIHPWNASRSPVFAESRWRASSYQESSCHQNDEKFRVEIVSAFNGLGRSALVQPPFLGSWE